MRLLLAFSILSTLPAFSAVDCTERDLQGPYGFLLSGVTTISGTEAPVAGLARIEFDGHSSISGYSSVNFNGLLLGNPVTGTYKVNNDCTVSLSLQDDSGAFQNFSGTLNQAGNRLSVRQTDRGTGERGLIAKSSNACATGSFRGQYSFTLSGAFTPLAEAGASGNISAKGLVEADGTGKFTLNRSFEREGNRVSVAAPGTFDVESDCIIRLEFTLPAIDGGAEIPLKLRGVLVNDGKEILAIETSPQETLSVQLVNIKSVSQAPEI